MKEVNILNYINKQNALITKEVQNIIDNNENGVKIIFPKGSYILSTIFLKSNVHIVLESGAIVLGAESFYDYAPEEKYDFPLYQDSSHSNFHCSMFVGINLENISITGSGIIDMRSVWDEDNVRNIKCRGAKCIALKNCKNVLISDLGIYNATDLAIYLAGCKNVEIFNVNMRVYIDGISPDNSQNVKIYNCDIETGDDGIVFKSSYNLNRYEECKDIEVYNCKVKSRCNAIKFGTESNCAFKNIYIHDTFVYDTRITGISIESVDGAVIDGITIKNITMQNVNAPIFVYLGDRLRGPSGTKIGSIQNILLENIKATGEYKTYNCIPWNYYSYKANDITQVPQIFGEAEGAGFNGNEYAENWQFTSNICGLEKYPLNNITLKNIDLELYGGVLEYNSNVPKRPISSYPEVFVYGRNLPASGLYCRYVNNLKLENVKVKTINKDAREFIVLEYVN